MNKEMRGNQNENTYFHHGFFSFTHINFPLVARLLLRETRSMKVLTEGNRDFCQEDAISFACFV